MFSQVIQHVEQYVSGRTSKEDFEIWLYDLAFDVEQRYTRRVISLVHNLEGIFSEASSGNWPEAILKTELGLLLRNLTCSIIVIGEPMVFRWAAPPLQIQVAQAM